MAELSARSKLRLAAISCYSRNGVCSSRSFFCQFDSTIPTELGAGTFRSWQLTSVTPSILFFEASFFPLGVLSRFSTPHHALRVFSFFSFFSSARDISFAASFEASVEPSPLAQSGTDANPVSGSASSRSSPSSANSEWKNPSRFRSGAFRRLRSFGSFSSSASALHSYYTSSGAPVRPLTFRFWNQISGSSSTSESCRRLSELQPASICLIVVKFAPITLLESSAVT